MEQLTKEQAIAFAESGEWKDWTPGQIVRFQLFQDRLCMPFDKFWWAMEKILDRPIFTHEFAFVERLRDEYLTLRPRPTLQEILDLIPAEKRVVLCLAPGEGQEAGDG